MIIILSSINSLYAQWLNINSVSRTSVNCFVSYGTILYTGTSSGIYYSSNNGTKWDHINTGLTKTNMLSLAVAGTNIFAGSDSGGVYLSTDSGATWASSLQITNPVLSLAEFKNGTPGSTIFAGSENVGGIYRSTDSGTDWTQLGMFSKHFWSLSVFYLSGGLEIIAGTDNGVYISTDIGVTWTQFNSGLTNLIVHALAISGTNIFAGTENGVFISTNIGTSWTQINNGLTNTNITSFAVSGIDLFAGTGKGVFMYNNKSSNWTQVNDGLSNTNILSLCVFNTNIFAGTDSSIWMRPLSEVITGVEKNKNNLPTSFSLWQNYPNPFNPVTTISFSIPKTGFVTLKVYDILGRDIATLVKEYRPAGNYSIKFDGSKTTSGVYFYRLQSGNYTETKKLLLIK